LWAGAHASAAAVLFTVVAVYFALRSSRAPAAEVRAAIKLTNFYMLPYTPGREYSNGNLFYFSSGAPAVKYLHKYGFQAIVLNRNFIASAPECHYAGDVLMEGESRESIKILAHFWPPTARMFGRVSRCAGEFVFEHSL